MRSRWASLRRWWISARRGFLTYDGANCTFVLVAHSQATRFAGNGTCGDTGDGGPATAAEITASATPSGMSPGVDTAGDVFFESDTGSNIRRIDATTGDISTVVSFPSSGPIVLAGVVEPDGQLTLLEKTQPDSSGSTADVLHRIDSSGNDTLLASTPTMGAPSGLVRLGDDHYALMEDAFNTDGTVQPQLVDFDNGSVTRTPLTVSAPLDSSWLLCADAVGPDGTIYGIAFHTLMAHYGRYVFRVGADRQVRTIAGTGAADPGSARQSAQADQLDLSVTTVAYTRHGNLLIASGHTVYDMADAADAPAITAPAS